MTTKEENIPVDYSKPVAYDVNGHPLYSHPPIERAKLKKTSHSQIVHLVRPSEPEQQVISDSTKLKHQKSKKVFPDINLSAGEYVIASVERHSIGLFLPVIIGFLLIIFALFFLLNFDFMTKSVGPMSTFVGVDSSTIIPPVTMFIILVILGMYVSYYVYYNNKLYLTNESIIQKVQISIFSKRERVVSLMDIEDLSFTQKGIFQQMFDFGSIRLSTEGEGTVYHFNFVKNPKEAIATLSNAVEAFKYGRAIS